MSIKALKRENLQLAVFTPFNILANNIFPLKWVLYRCKHRLSPHCRVNFVTDNRLKHG